MTKDSVQDFWFYVSIVPEFTSNTKCGEITYSLALCTGFHIWGICCYLLLERRLPLMLVLCPSSRKSLLLKSLSMMQGQEPSCKDEGDE
ncbi:hypothetical protein Hdeb2414_s0568g00917741 [Helianthus debilis subsp. tardiflorus]